MTDVTARFATEAERQDWDTLIAGNPAGGDFLMAASFAATKESVGWIPRHLIFSWDGVTSAALVLERRVPLLGRYWYLVKGPSVTTPEQFLGCLDALRAMIAREKLNVFAVTTEPPLLDDEATNQALAPIAADRRPGIQGNTYTAIVNVNQDDDALMKSFDSKCRNMIRRAIRDGHEVREYPAEPETYRTMHRLMRLVGGGKANLRLRSEAYTETFWNGFSGAGQGTFYGIDVDGSPAVMAYLIIIGDRAFYKDGGSERERVSPGMSNLVQWHMMRAARDAGCVSYDMVGVPPTKELNNPEHLNFSVGKFKLAFSRVVTEHIGCYEVVIRPTQAKLWDRIGKRVVSKLHRRRTGDLDLF